MADCEEKRAIVVVLIIDGLLHVVAIAYLVFIAGFVVTHDADSPVHCTSRSCEFATANRRV